ncbi:hypothetical protein ABEB36_008064 [Hypothenemus hampei]|uniref:Uncharacterized protein n=1 Tax=Hypothenemus hampei TaxID=57062 RepID=A0ABD1EKL3_HYPHA
MKILFFGHLLSYRKFTHSRAVLFNLLFFPKPTHLQKDGYSFFKFYGPVNGDEQQIIIKKPSDTYTIDFWAKPDYFFHYGVQDSETGNSQTHEQSRDDDRVEGEYRVLQEDGLTRIVRYFADPEIGFQANIEYARIDKK